MKPCNEKSLFHFLLGAMDKVASGEMDFAQAKAITDLSKEAEKLLRGERERCKLEMQMDEHQRNFNKRPILRELASKGFVNTTDQFIEE